MIFESNHAYHGRLGNQVMRLMGLIGLAKELDCEYAIPEWPYAKYFETPINQKNVPCTQRVREEDFHYNLDFWRKYNFKETNIDIVAWLQSYKYYSEKLKFKPSFLSELRGKHKEIFEKPTIAISIRRGDFVGHAGYYQLPVTYYICALFKHFPGFQNYNIVLFSDDITYCKIHFSCLPNAYFPGGSDIEQMALMSECDNHIISNSTFSWCGAYLSDSTRIVRPLYNFDGFLRERHSEKDFWPPHWQIFQHEENKIDLRDCTFLIPVSYDHPDRRKNLELSVCMLQRELDTNVMIMEHGGEHFSYMSKWCDYRRFTGNSFHRTRMLNEMTIEAKTPIIINYDADNVTPPLQLWIAAEKIRRGADMVYPFDGQSARVPRTEFPKVEKYLDAGVLTSNYRGMGNFNSVGHAIFFKKESFIKGGMENENMISWGPEDAERFERFTRLGFRVERVKGAIYHMDHFKGVNSSKGHGQYESNVRELEKIRGMTENELRQYITSYIKTTTV